MSERRRVPVDRKSGRAKPVDFLAGAEAPRAEPEPDCSCPRLDPADWDDVDSDWSDITFLRATTSAVLGVPIGYGDTRNELREKAAKLGATVPEDAMLLMGSGRFRRPIMLEVEGGEGKEFVRPGGFAYSRLVEAPWGQMGSKVDETKDAARERHGRDPDSLWIWYLTCRECSAARNFETLVLAHFRDS